MEASPSARRQTKFAYVLTIETSAFAENKETSAFASYNEEIRSVNLHKTWCFMMATAVHGVGKNEIGRASCRERV